MNGIPQYGTGRHEDYLVQQEERAEVARDLEAEQEHAEWTGWMDAQGYATSQRQGSEGYGGGDMFDAFKGGMQATRDLDDAQERPEPSGEPLTHFFHCWRFPDHHACAVALIERQQEENDALLVRGATAERKLADAGLEPARAHREKGSPSS
jgi:hypothetical protein